MSSAEKYIPRYTVSDHKNWKGDWELIEGIPVSMSPSPYGPHERAVVELVYAFKRMLEEGDSDCRVYAGLDWVVDDETVVRPDLMVVCGEQPEAHLEKAPILVAEVLSKSTRVLDLGAKRRLYKDNGVSAYLILDVNEKTIEIDEFKGQPRKFSHEEELEISLAEFSATIGIAKIFS